MDNQIWLNINEYCLYRDLSISTIRRYIKLGTVQYKKEDGKYLILANKEAYLKSSPHQKELMELKLENQFLKEKVHFLEEEKNDLMMLVKVYENSSVNSLPEIPEVPKIK